jgi:predicted nucleic acid-binding protein
MSRAPLRAVVDASVAVKLFVPEVLSAQAQKLFTRFGLESDAELFVPDFFFIECANVFWKWVQRSAYPQKQAGENLLDLMDLGLEVIPAQLVVEEALEIALKYKITTYDASYVATAAHLKLPLITADEKLARLVAKGPHDVRWLGKEAIT